MSTKFRNIKFILAIIISFVFVIQNADAQKGNRGGGGGGGNRGGGAASKPAAAPSQKRSINGGSVKSPERSKPTPSANDRSVANQNSGNRTNAGNNNNVGNKNNTVNNNSGNKTNVGSGNKVNVDNSKNNVNINVDNSKNVKVNNSHNTSVRRNNNYRPYSRPPYRYGGYNYNCYHPYHYHPYHAHYWGPVWHPWGFFVATLAVTAVVLTVESQQYHYDQGVYYVPSNGGYTVVAAPIGATIATLPAGSETIDNSNSNNTTTNSNNTTVVNNYYYGGTYYEKSSGGYTVVPPTAGNVVENLPEGGEEVKIGDVTYVKVGETYYQPFEQDGKNMYEVVDVQKES